MRFTYNDVRQRLGWGEFDELEFKPDPVSDKVLIEQVFETIVGMANVSGGDFVIGVRDILYQGA